jgi:hypothetical protein
MPAAPGESRRKAPNGIMRAQVVALFDVGYRVADIVRELGISKQAAHFHLNNAGRGVPRAAAQVKQRRTWAVEWNTALDLASVARRWGLTPHQARRRSWNLRHRFGLTLKRLA